MVKVSNIPGFSRYYISKRGRLYRNSGKEWVKIKPCIKNTGYASNILVDDKGKKHNIYRHRLVAKVWIPNPDNLPQVCHKDNNPLNNRCDNLYWGTALDNMTQCVRDGNFYYVGYARKKHIDEEALCREYLEGISRKELLIKYRISAGVFYKILRVYKIPFRKPWNSREHKQWKKLK